MTNKYYSHADGVPVAGTRGVTSPVQNEFDLIAAGFDSAATDILASNPIRNLIDNPGFDVFQKAAQNTTTPTWNIGISNEYLDRWGFFGLGGAGAGKMTRQVNTVPSPIARYMMKIEAATGVAQTAWASHAFPAKYMKAVAGTTVTLSFKTKQTTGSGSTIKLSGSYNTTEDDGTFATAFLTSVTIGTVAHDATNWTTVSYSFTVPAGATKGMILQWYLNNTVDNATKAWYISEPQLEPGSTATEFSLPSDSTTLAICKYYLPGLFGEYAYQQTLAIGYAISATQVLFVVPIPRVRKAVSSINWNYTGAALTVGDGVNTPVAVSSLDYSIAPTNRGVDTVGFVAIVAGGLTQFRPYVLICPSSSEHSITFGGATLA